MFSKIGLIGGGMIGGVLAQEVVRRHLAKTVALMDIKPPDLARGKCLDIAEGSPLIGSDFEFVAGKDYDVLDGADLVINTAGVPRSMRPDGTFPGREELLGINLKITDAVSDGIRKYCPEAIVISIANPLDAIVYTLWRNLEPDRNRLIGMAGALDGARYRYFVAKAAGVSVSDVQAMVLGGHGDTMVPIRSCCRIAGMPVEKFVSPAELDKIEERTRKAGGEVVSLLGTGSAFVSPAWSALQMVEAVLYDKKQVIPSCVLCQGEYGFDGLFVGVPAVLGRNGVERIIEIDLTGDEKAALQKSADAVKTTCAEVDKMKG
jgi:malate dehydrogenase